MSVLISSPPPPVTLFFFFFFSHHFVPLFRTLFTMHRTQRTITTLSSSRGLTSPGLLRNTTTSSSSRSRATTTSGSKSTRSAQNTGRQAAALAKHLERVSRNLFFLSLALLCYRALPLSISYFIVEHFYSVNFFSLCHFSLVGGKDFSIESTFQYSLQFSSSSSLISYYQLLSLLSHPLLVVEKNSLLRFSFSFFLRLTNMA